MDARPAGSAAQQAPSAYAPVAGPDGNQETSPAAGLDQVDVELARLADLTVADHVEIFTAIHQRLAAALAVAGSQGDKQGGDQQHSGQQNAGQQYAGQHRPGQPGTPRPGQPSAQWGR
jgi:hypothetical protein